MEQPLLSFSKRSFLLCLGILLAANVKCLVAFEDNNEQSVIIVHAYKDEKLKIIEKDGISTKGDISFLYTYGITPDNIPQNFVGIRVNQGKVLVHNSAFLETLCPSDKTQDEKDYIESGMLLKNYIERQFLAAFTKKGLNPDQEILVYHPLTACPMVVSIDEWIANTQIWNSSYGSWNRKWRPNHYLYPPVITIQGPIPPNKLIFPAYGRPFGDDMRSTTVINSIICRKYCTSSRWLYIKNIFRLIK